jgi:dihydroorotase
MDCSGWIVSPGLIDLHVHLREPGGSAKETIATGTAAAAAGGFTSVVAMPNTQPPADGPNTIAWLRQRAAEQAAVHVFFTGCISAGMKGEILAPMGSLQKAGVVAFTDDGACIQSNELMRRALEYARMLGLPVFDHCQDYDLSRDGAMNEGYWSTVLGLPGWPAIAEEIIINRNAMLSELTGARIHCQHVTTAGGARILREARQRGIAISGEIMPHHLALTDDACQSYNTVFKMNPPLRTRRDIEALKQALVDGTIDILASDHAPHCDYEKEVEFTEAPFGIIGLETELAIFIRELILPGVLNWSKMLAMLTINPARLLKLDLAKGHLAPGADADVTVIDPGRQWKVDREQFRSKSRNTPFQDWELQGRSVLTIVGGNPVHSLLP